MNSTAPPDRPPDLAELRTELEEGMARMLRHSAGDRLDDGEIEAAARAVVAGEGLPEPAASVFAERPVGALVSFDADRIQSWVFGSERIQVASGASFTLDDLNRFVREEATKLPGVHGVVFSAGGGGMLFAAPDADPHEIRRRLEAKTKELTFTVVAREVGARDLAKPRGRYEDELAFEDPGVGSSLGRLAVARGLHGLLVRMQIAVRREKEAHPRPMARPLEARPGTAAERCPSCNRRPPRRKPVTGDGIEFWCDWCEGMRARVHRPEDGADPWERDGRTLTFEDLAGASRAGRPYLAFFAADGNGMGRLAQGLTTFLELRAFSEATTHVYESARHRVQEVLANSVLDEGWDPEHAKLSLLSGGDEITLVLPSAPAPRVALAVLEEIERGFDRVTRPGGLLARALGDKHPVLAQLERAGAGAGLLVAPKAYPVRLLRHYAQGLQREAKRRCARENQRSAIAWTLLTDGSPLPRGLEDGTEPSYSPHGFSRLLEETRAAEEAGVPNSLLHNLLAHKRREEKGLEKVFDEAGERNRVLPHLVASFFRYQLARHTTLRTWWQAIQEEKADAAERHGPEPAGDEDPILRWLSADRGRRLDEVTDLLSLEPFRTRSRPQSRTEEVSR